MVNAVSDKTIREMIAEGVNIVDPLDKISIQPASIDLRLGDTLYEYKLSQYILGETIDEKKVEKRTFKTHALQNGETAFVGIFEKICIPDNMIGVIFPRSSITRLGIYIATTYMNPGYKGYMPLTITNQMGREIILQPGYRVAQLVLWSLDKLPEKVYKDTEAKYYNENVDHSQLHRDVELLRSIREKSQLTEEQAFALGEEAKHNIWNKLKGKFFEHE
jgi:dCTP deaminase